MVTKYNHLALVRRDEVVELFKNGVIYPASSIQFAGSVESLLKRPKEVARVFAKTPAIEYSVNFFLLYAETKREELLRSQGLNIQELVSIIPLDEESARMGLSLTPPVRLDEPKFAPNFMDYKEKAAIENAKKGVGNIGEIFGFDDLWKSIKKFTVKKSLSALVSLVLDETGSRQPQTIWEYLITYTRNQTYPNDIRGAFLDTMSVVNNYKKQRVVSKDQKGTSTGRLIVEQEHPLYVTLIESVGASDDFIKAADKGYKDFWKIAPLYFVLLDAFSNVSEDGALVMGKPIKSYVESVAKNYDKAHLKPALLMLGITLGQSSTYKILYCVKKSELSFLL